MKWNEFEKWIAEDRSRDTGALELFSQYKVKKRSAPFEVGDVIHSDYVRADVITSINTKKDRYFRRSYHSPHTHAIEGEDFRKNYKHITKKQLDKYVLQEYMRIYMNQCYNVLYFLTEQAKQNSNETLAAWAKEGIKLCREFLSVTKGKMNGQ